MKKIFTLIFLATATLSLTSCFKSWICECTSSGGSYAGFTTTETISTGSTGFKSKQKKECEARNRYDVSGGDTSIRTCVLK